MPHDEQAALKQPIIILGAPRSGTTQLGAIFASHTDVCYVEEPRLTWRYGNHGKSDMLGPQDAREKVVRHIRHNFARRVLASGRRRLAEKTPSNGLRVAFIDRVFPDCKFIHIIRNGVEAALATHSLSETYATGMHFTARRRLFERLAEVGPTGAPYYVGEMLRRAAPAPLRRVLGPNVWGPRIPGIEQMIRELDPLDVSCLQWRMCVELACRDGRKLPPDRYLELRLEELGQDSIRRVMRFCNLGEQDPVMEKLGRGYNREQAARRLADADPAQLDRVHRWVDPTMCWLEQTRGWGSPKTGTVEDTPDDP